MRKIGKIIVHCSDTRTNQDFSIDDIKDWHLQRGFNDVGYHYYIKLNGEIQNGRSIDKVGAHCKGENFDSIGVCFEGGKLPNGDKWDEPNGIQLNSFDRLKDSLDVVLGEELEIKGHYEYSIKTCPNFNVDILK